MLHMLQEKVLTVGELRHRFDNAWQPVDSYLRLYQPLSFDLVDPSKIVEKAIHWNGLVRQLRKRYQDFYIYLLLGRPSDDSDGGRLRAFQQAYEALGEDRDRKELVPEEEAPRFGETVEKEIKAAA
ncbi:MAG: hypothetical protein ACREP9_08585 [Candidatus Dormibacteraceae bacterium]